MRVQLVNQDNVPGEWWYAKNKDFQIGMTFDVEKKKKAGGGYRYDLMVTAHNDEVFSRVRKAEYKDGLRHGGGYKLMYLANSHVMELDEITTNAAAKLLLEEE